MWILEDFWAFNFQLTNSHLFQEKLIPARHENAISQGQSIKPEITF